MNIFPPGSHKEPKEQGAEERITNHLKLVMKLRSDIIIEAEKGKIWRKITKQGEHQNKQRKGKIQQQTVKVTILKNSSEQRKNQ